MSVTHFTEERCVMCGEIVEEGRQACFRCDKLVYLDKPEPQTTTHTKHHSGLFARLLTRKGD